MGDIDNTPQTAGQYLDWGDDEWKYFKGWLEDLLRLETVELEFVKADGSQRTLRATKNGLSSRIEDKKKRQEIAGVVKESTTRQRKPGGGEYNVLLWDIDADDWRTVKVKNITNIYTLMLKYDFKIKKPFDEWL